MRSGLLVVGLSLSALQSFAAEQEAPGLLLWEAPCAFRYANGKAYETAIRPEHCDYLANKKLTPAGFAKKSPEEQRNLLEAAAKVFQEYESRKKALISRPLPESAPGLKRDKEEVVKEQARAAALFGMSSAFLKDFTVRRQELDAAIAGAAAKGRFDAKDPKSAASGLKAGAGKLGEKGADQAAAGREVFDADTRKVGKDSGGGTAKAAVSSDKAGGGQLQKAAALADKTQARFDPDRADIPPMAAGPGGAPALSSGPREKPDRGYGLTGMRTFRPDPDDKGGKDIDRLYRSVYATHGEQKLGSGIMGSMVGNSYDMKEDMKKEAWEQKVTGIGTGLQKAGGLAFAYTAGVPIDVAVIGQATADKAARATYGRLPNAENNPYLPTLPKADDKVFVAGRPGEGEASRQTSGPFMICGEWQAAISKTADDPRNKLDFQGYKKYTPSGGVFGPLRTSHNWVSFVNCDRGTIVVADPWRYGKALKEVPATPENVAYHTSEELKSCP